MPRDGKIPSLCSGGGKQRKRVVRTSNLPPPPPPAVPSNLRVTAKTASSLSLKWSDNSNNERRFFINYEGSGESRPRANLGASTTSHLFTGLDSNKQYCFNGQAENLFGVSASTPLVCGRTSPEPQPTPTPTTSPQPGFSSIHVFNCNVDQRPVHIWTRNVTQSVWVNRGTVAAQYSRGSCPGSSAPFKVPLEDGHSFWFVAVDPQLIACDGQNNPELSACQRSIFTKPLPGKANGPALPHTIN